MSTYLTKTRALAAAVLLAIAVAFGLATAPQSQAYAEGGDSQLAAQGLQTQDAVAAFDYDGDKMYFPTRDLTSELSMLSNSGNMTISLDNNTVTFAYPPSNTKATYKKLVLNADITATQFFDDSKEPTGDVVPLNYSNSNTYVSFSIPVSYCGKATPVAPLKAKCGVSRSDPDWPATWTTATQYYLAIPALDKMFSPEETAPIYLEFAKTAVKTADEKAAAADEAAKAADAAIDKAAKSGTVEDATAAVAAADKATKAAAEAAEAAADAKKAADTALKSANNITDANEKAQAVKDAQVVADAANSAVSKAETAKTAAAAAATKATEAKKVAEEAAAAAAAEAKKAAEEAAAAAKAPKDNTMQVSVKKTNTLKAKKLAKKKQVVKAITVTDAKGAVTFSKVKVNKKKFAKKFTVNKKTGKITVKKGVKKGTYKVTVKVSAAGEGQFQPAEKNVVVKIKVK